MNHRHYMKPGRRAGRIVIAALSCVSLGADPPIRPPRTGR